MSAKLSGTNTLFGDERMNGAIHEPPAHIASVPARRQPILERVEVATCLLRAGRSIALNDAIAVRALELCDGLELSQPWQATLPAGVVAAPGETVEALDRAESRRGWTMRRVTVDATIRPASVATWIASTSGRDGLAELMRHASRGDAVDAAAIELCKLAGLLPAALIEDVADNGNIATSVSIDDVLGFREAQARSVRPVVEARLPMHGAENASLIAFRASYGGIEHVAIRIGEIDPENDGKPPLCRLHSSCFTGDLLGSLRCDCGDQLQGAIHRIAEEGSGIVLYLAQEGRGIGLVNKLRAYRMQDEGLDTIEANEHLGFLADERDWLMPAIMLQQMGIHRIRLLTNNPTKVSMIQRHGIEVAERVPHAFAANPHNQAYLATKAERGGHYLDHDIACLPRAARG